jgi:streptomycin 6-kinase
VTRAVPPIPESLRENLAYTLGDLEADRWLAHAVENAAELLAEWDLVPEQVLSGGSESLCIKCDDAEGRPTVLKLPASQAGGAAEIAALHSWGGEGAARVLRQDDARCAVLMNFLGWVGDAGFDLEDVLDLAGRLHAAPVDRYPFPPLEQNLARRIGWAVDRFREPGNEPQQEDLDRAQKLLGELLADAGDPADGVLLHGDLQAKNLILAGSRLTAVDPLPVLGPPVFDVAFWCAKSVHEESVSAYLDRVRGLRPELDGEALVRWTWAIAVVENRPGVPRGAVRRQWFIDDLREEVLR